MQRRHNVLSEWKRRSNGAGGLDGGLNRTAEGRLEAGTAVPIVQTGYPTSTRGAGEEEAAAVVAAIHALGFHDLKANFKPSLLGQALQVGSVAAAPGQTPPDLATVLVRADEDGEGRPWHESTQPVEIESQWPFSPPARLFQAPWPVSPMGRAANLSVDGPCELRGAS